MILFNICVLIFFSSELLYTSSGKSLRAARNLLSNFDDRLLMWAKLVFVYFWLCTVPMLWGFINSYCCFPSFSSSVLSLIFSHQEGKDKSFLLDKLQKLQKSNKKPAQKNQKRVCCQISFMLTNQTSLWDLLSNSPHRPFFLLSLANPQLFQWPLLGQ